MRLLQRRTYVHCTSSSWIRLHYDHCNTVYVCILYLFLVEGLVEDVELDREVLREVLHLHRGVVLDASSGEVLKKEKGSSVIAGKLS